MANYFRKLNEAFDRRYGLNGVFESERCKLIKNESGIIKEDTEIDRYQRWVDFDMNRYGKISGRTQQMVNKAGYQILKNDHGDYEVAAGHFE